MSKLNTDYFARCINTLEKARYFATPKQADKLVFKDIFRYAAKYDLITLAEAERWLQYRDNRNDTAHDYGVGFADETLILLPQFIKDAYKIHAVI
ncbi:MAG: hypothetical protein EPN89_14075 [Methylovulum sp.]|nr:MAG: hypothetical protein EPN89_14075 [Methylovulum sp.]